MLLTPPPGLVALVQALTAKETVRATYTLRQVSPRYFLQELDSPQEPLRPPGVRLILTEDIKGTITVLASPAAHLALQPYLHELDRRDPPAHRRWVTVQLEGDADRLPWRATLTPTASSAAELGVRWNAAELAEQEKRPFPCRYPVLPEQSLLFVVHPGQDRESIRLEIQWKTRKPSSPTISLTEVSVTPGVRTPVTLHSPVPPAFQSFSLVVHATSGSTFP